MVLIHCKRLPREEHSKDYDEFLYVCPNTSTVTEVTEAVTKIQNMRVRIKWMVMAAKDIAKDSLPAETKETMLGPAQAAESFLNIERCTVAKTPCTVEECLEHIEMLKACALMLFPKECSEKNACAMLGAELDNDATSEARRALVHRLLSLIDDGAVTDDILQGPTCMWWTGKQMMKDKTIKDYAGKNDKTKLVVKVTKDGAAPPPREPGLDAKTQSEMMAYWYKKQEEQKKLVEDDDISYGNSQWADSQGLKKALSGMESVKFR